MTHKAKHEMDAPEQIHVRIHYHIKNGFTGLPELSNCWPDYKGITTYTRSDLYDALKAENERLRGSLALAVEAVGATVMALGDTDG